MSASEHHADGRRRAVLEGLEPAVDAGRFPIKRVLGDEVVVRVDAFTDGHDQMRVRLRQRHEKEADWRETSMRALGNDRWEGRFTVTELGRYRYSVTAWVDHYLSWHHDLGRREDPKDVALALEIGAGLARAAAARAKGIDARRLEQLADSLTGSEALESRRAIGMSEELEELMGRYPDRALAVDYPREFEVVVDSVLARFGAWYELFPRSCTDSPAHHGTFADCEARLPYVAGMGFDVLYLPPIHPIGRVDRKGPNNTLDPGPDDPGSPWAIGAEEGGHKDILPQLGTLEDFRHLVARAEEFGLKLAMDIAFQCAPDHPYVKQHPQWFRWRPDNTVQYAENPPKKYQDIFPFDFECDDWQALWAELKSVFDYWLDQGVTVFRVDNPHTKPFPFWEWCIGEIKRVHPEALFLSEAFTRPRVMHRLAKLGFSQSYNYFPWRNTRWELTEYLTELTQEPGREYFRPNLWPNTPDILPEYLQLGGRPAFMTRLVLAATMGSSYGIYGPAFELCDNAPRAPGAEEYLNSEKYQIKVWDLEREDSLCQFITRVNGIRHEHPALQQDWNLRFYPVDNDQLICFGKLTEDLEDVLLVVVNLDPHHRQSGWVELPLHTLALDDHQPYQVHDLLSNARYLWQGPRNFVELDPQAPAHIFRLRRRVHTERDFDYYL
jgi:starch synthase (maltosyl-transferring)